MELMWKKKRGSTLVMVLCVFAFVLIVGVGVMTLAGVASKQMSNTLGQQRADAAAYSVLDTVSTQIMDRTIDPFALGKGATYKTEGGGTDDTLGKYNILIEKAEKADEKNLFKVGVTLERNGYVSSVYNLLKYTTGGSGMPDLKKTFDVTTGATSANRKAASLPTDVGASKIVGSIFVDNGNNLSMMFGNTGVTQNVDMIGHVNLEDGTFGTKDAGNHINATESLFVSTPQPVYGEIHAGTDVIIEKSSNVTENIYANGSVLVGANARINGDIHAGGDVEVSSGARVSGVIYANGDVKVNKARTNNDIFAQGNVRITDNAVTQNIYTNGEVTMQNSSINGDISAVGKVDVNGTVAGKITTNGNCTVKGTVGKDIHACGDVLLQNIKRIKDVFAGGTLSADGINGSVNCSAEKDMTLKNCNLYFAAFKTNGILRSTNTILEECTIAAAGGMIDEGGQLTAIISSNGDIDLSGTRILGTLSTTENIIMENGSTVEDSPYAGADVGDIRCGKNLIIKTDSNFSKVVFVDGDFLFDQKSAITGGVLVQGNASLTNNASLVGTLTVKGNALLTGIPGTQSVTGVIMLGGQLDPASTPGLNNRIVNVDPSAIPPMPPITRVDQDLSVPPIPDFALPNTLPVVELNLEQKYEKVPMLV
ncbi:MAG: polymer-forming cytoskeletal protein, partial [Christensenella sp.]